MAKATTASENMKETIKNLGEELVTATDYNVGPIRHIVLFRYKEDVSLEKKEEVKNRFLSLAEDCKRDGRKYILSIETGAQSSGEGVDQEFEQAFIVSFRSEGDRNYYVGKDLIKSDGNYDPVHDAFKAFVGPLLYEPIDPKGVLVFDFPVENQISN